MKVLLRKNIERLGIVGDVVDVATGYARNYLVPYGLATEPTQVNMRALAEARRAAEFERARFREQMEKIAERLAGVEVTIQARANEEGVLYGSVGKREIARALFDEGYPVKPEHIVLERPIRQLDNVSVDVKLADDLCPSVKVWVVREQTADEEAAEAAPEAAQDERAVSVGKEADANAPSDDE